MRKPAQSRRIPYLENDGTVPEDVEPLVQYGALVTRPFGFKRWLVIWLVPLSLSATLVRYFDSGPPTSWPNLARLTTEIFLAPGGTIWTALFWRAFGSGPTIAGLVFIVLVNSILWAVAVYLAIQILGRLPRR